MAESQPAPVNKNEVLKQSIPTLAGQIAATLADPTLDRFSEDDTQFTKFHGIYQQDDRDLRKTAKKYIMMIRSRIPGGVMTAKQWTVFRLTKCCSLCLMLWLLNPWLSRVRATKGFILWALM